MVSSLIEITPNDRAEDEPEVFDFSSPEDVLVEIVGPHDDNHDNKAWANWSIETCAVVGGANPEVTGAASYENSYGGFLDHRVEELIDCPGAGWFVVTGVTGSYYRGDGWETDDTMDFECTGVRPATEEEIALA